MLLLLPLIVLTTIGDCARGRRVLEEQIARGGQCGRRFANRTLASHLSVEQLVAIGADEFLVLARYLFHLLSS